MATPNQSQQIILYRKSQDKNFKNEIFEIFSKVLYRKTFGFEQEVINLKKRYMKKSFFTEKTFLIIVLILLISVSGCSRKKAVEKKLEDIRTGTQGIVMNFLPNAPPDKIHVEEGDNADSTFDIILELRNKGAYPQPDDRMSAPSGIVYLSGYDSNIIRIGDGTPYQNIDRKSLEGKSTINPNGGLDLVTFKGWVAAENLKVEKYEPTLLVTACYIYYTVAGPSVCIDPNPYSVTQKKVCHVQSISLSNQGAPISVTRIDEEALSLKTQFKITIKNVGGGDVISVGSTTKCITAGREDIDKVKVEEIRVGKDPLENCRPFIGTRTTGPSGEIRLINGEGFILCDLPKELYKDSVTAYTTPLTIKLSYYYRNTAEKKIQIKKEMSGNLPSSGGISDYPIAVQEGIVTGTE